MNNRRFSPKLLRGILQIGVSVVLLAIVLRRVDWRELQAALAQMSLPWLAAAWALFLLGVVVRAFRWQTLLLALDVRAPLRQLILWYFVGGFFNVILPTGFGGDAVRVIELGHDTQRTGAVLASVVLDRYLGLIALLGMGVFAGLLRPALAPGYVLVALAALLAGGLFAALLLTRPWWARWASGGGRRAQITRASRLPDLSASLSGYGREVLARAVAISVLFNLMQIAWNVLIGIGLGVQAPVALYFVIVPLTSAALLLPAFGGLGVREISYVALLGAAGVPESTALAFSLSIYAITVVTGLVGGLMYLGVGLRRARRKS